jgi:hypothetical protein
MEGEKSVTGFLSVIDFGGILVPGGVLAWLIKDTPWIQSFLLLVPIPESESGRILFFGFVALLLGYLLSAIGSWTLDILYDLLFGMSGPWRRKVTAKLMQAAKTVVEEKFGQSNFSVDNSVMRWSGMFVRVRKPEAGAALDQIEAISKLFRSLTLVFLQPFVWHIIFIGSCGCLGALL